MVRKGAGIMNKIKISEMEIQYQRRLLVQGLILYLLGLLGPFFFPAGMFHIYQDLTAAMSKTHCSGLLTAALQLVFLNVVRMFPHYLGAFLMNESLHFHWKEKKIFLPNICLTFGLILLMYRMIDVVHKVHYDFGFPAFLTICCVLLLSYLNLFEVSMLNKIILVFSLLMAVQWLDVVPGLTEYGFGRGDVSTDIKTVAEYMQEEKLLTIFAVCMIAAFAFASAIQIELLLKEHTLKISNEQRRAAEQHLYETQIEALKMRNASEAQNLVHDLKSPLTTAQGLISLAAIMEENPLIQEYFNKITVALENMSVMISEILYENTRELISTEELLKTVLSQVSIRIPNSVIRYTNTCPDTVLNGNKIRLARAVVNLVNNAYAEISPETGVIDVRVENRGNGFLGITVRDNGKGISPEVMPHIFDIGYSGKQSTGLGLAFTKQVVQNHGGTIRLDSREGEYTEAVILLPAGQAEPNLTEKDQTDSKENTGTQTGEEQRKNYGVTGKKDTVDR
jgi:signal transduction histidine kinase